MEKLQKKIQTHKEIQNALNRKLLKRYKDESTSGINIKGDHTITAPKYF